MILVAILSSSVFPSYAYNVDVVDKGFYVYQQDELYGYVNQNAGTTNQAAFVIACPFIDGYACCMTEDWNIHLIDQNFNVLWSSYDVVNLAPKIGGETIGMTGEEFDAWINDILGSMDGTVETDVTRYYNGLNYVTDVYSKRMYEIDEGIGDEWVSILETSLANGEKMYNDKLAEVDRYYREQELIIDYLKRRSASWN